MDDLGHTLLVTSQGQVWGCGNNKLAQLGREDSIIQEEFRPISGLPKISQVYVASSHSFFLDTHGRAWGCGYNESGCLGITLGDITGNTPSSIRITSIAANTNVTFFLDDRRQVWFSGYLFGLKQSQTTRRISNLKDIVAISTNNSYLVALDRVGQIWELGLTAPRTQTEIWGPRLAKPTRFLGLPRIKSVIAGHACVFAIDYDANLWCYGRNSYYQVSDSGINTSSVLAPQLIPITDRVVKVSAATNHVLILTQSQQVFGSASAMEGEFHVSDLIGMGNLSIGDDLRCPLVLITTLEVRIEDILAQGFNSFFLDIHGQVWACGANLNRSLGLSENDLRHSYRTQLSDDDLDQSSLTNYPDLVGRPKKVQVSSRLDSRMNKYS